MNPELEKKLKEALADTSNIGELPDADSVGTVGNSDCGEMLRMWIKFREDKGRKVIDKATFQSFGCETAIAVAALATRIIQGKTADEALSLKPEDLSGELGPLPPMKIHCAQLVEGALKSALTPAGASPAPAPAPASSASGTLVDSLQNENRKSGTIQFIPKNK
jgi:NifU-like protein involved in Fe-S cluster formation